VNSSEIYRPRVYTYGGSGALPALTNMRYVPKTYNNKRILRIIIRTFVAVLLAVVVAFIALFFSMRNYIIYNPDGTLKLELPWLTEEQAPPPAP